MFISATSLSRWRSYPGQNGNRQTGSPTFLGRFVQLGGEILIVAEERRQVGSERHARRAGQRREHQHRVGLLLVGKADRVGQHQPALGIRVANLDALPAAAGQHVARAGRHCLRCCSLPLE